MILGLKLTILTDINAWLVKQYTTFNLWMFHYRYGKSAFKILLFGNCFDKGAILRCSGGDLVVLDKVGQINKDQTEYIVTPLTWTL